MFFDADNAANQRMGYWLSNIAKHADPGVKKALFCNKIDLMDTSHVEKSSQVRSGRLLAAEHGLPMYLTSAKTGSGVDFAFDGLVQEILQMERSRTDTSPGNSQREDENSYRKSSKRRVVALRKCNPGTWCLVS